jgi:ribosome-binding factor A
MSRQERVAQTLKKEISIIIHEELKDPRLGFVTVTKVELSQDMRYAKIFFSVLGEDEAHRKTSEALNSSQGFIRRLIAQRVKLRFAPEIIFREDRSIEYSVRVQEILNDLEPRESPKRKKRAAKKDKAHNE